MRTYKRNWNRCDPYAARQKNVTGAKKCPDMKEYIGNIFLLGLTTLAGELIDMQAANALNVLLAPFQNEQDIGDVQEILSSDVEDTDIIDLLDGLI